MDLGSAGSPSFGHLIRFYKAETAHGIEPVADKVQVDLFFFRPQLIHVVLFHRPARGTCPFYNNVPVDSMIKADSEQDHSTLKTLLITSFSIPLRLGRVYWPKRFTGWQKDA